MGEALWRAFRRAHTAQHCNEVCPTRHPGGRRAHPIPQNRLDFAVVPLELESHQSPVTSAHDPTGGQRRPLQGQGDDQIRGRPSGLFRHEHPSGDDTPEGPTAGRSPACPAQMPTAKSRGLQPIALGTSRGANGVDMTRTSRPQTLEPHVRR